MKNCSYLCDADEFEVRLVELATLAKPEHAREAIDLVHRLREIFDHCLNN